MKINKLEMSWASRATSVISGVGVLMMQNDLNLTPLEGKCIQMLNSKPHLDGTYGVDWEEACTWNEAYIWSG